MLGIEEYQVITKMAETQIKNWLENEEPGPVSAYAAAYGTFELWDAVKSLAEPSVVAGDRERLFKLMHQGAVRRIADVLENAAQ